MKKVYTLLAFFLVALSIQAQTLVTFAVDMSNETDFDGVFVAGAFQNWTPGDGALEDQGNGVWARSYNLAPGSYQYKFGKGNDWGDNEGGDGNALTADCSVDDGSGNINRTLEVTDENMTVLFVYNSCEESDLSVSINEVSTIKGLEIFPNPMIGTANIRFDNNGGAAHDISITNLNGQLVREYRGVRGNSLSVERGNLAAGLYFVTFRNNKGETGTVRLMVQ